MSEAQRYAIKVEYTRKDLAPGTSNSVMHELAYSLSDALLQLDLRLGEYKYRVVSAEPYDVDKHEHWFVDKHEHWFPGRDLPPDTVRVVRCPGCGARGKVCCGFPAEGPPSAGDDLDPYFLRSARALKKSLLEQIALPDPAPVAPYFPVIPFDPEKKYEFKGLSCDTHDLQAHRRERLVLGPWTCTVCAPAPEEV